MTPTVYTCTRCQTHCTLTIENSGTQPNRCPWYDYAEWVEVPE
jgi:DNA-directed RNA polymerase subunit RPC12/RpoP